MRRIAAAVAVSMLSAGLAAVPAQAAVPTAAGMRWDLDGTATLLPPPPGSTRAYPAALSDNNFAAGFAWMGSGSTEKEHGVLWDAAGTATDLVPAPGDLESSARAVNNDGTAAGKSYGGSGFQTHAARWSADGTVTRLAEVPGAADTEVWGLAADGTAVGQSGSADVTAKPVRWAPDGTMTVLALPAGSTRGVASYITDTGWIAGYAFVGEEMDVVRWSPAGELTNLGAPATSTNSPEAMADDGSVLGTSVEYYDIFTPKESWSQVWDPAGTRTVLQRPQGYAFGAGYAMNNSHVVVGQLSGDVDVKMARWSPDGTFTVLPKIGTTYYEVTGINDAGLVSGSADNEAVRWSADGVLTELGVPPGCVSARGVAINDSGSVLGLGQ